VRVRGGALVAAVAALALGACADGDPGAGGDVESLGDLVVAPVADELTEAGRCPDGRLWAADDAGSVAVVVDPRAVEEVVLPSEDVSVDVLHGDLDDPCRAAGEATPGAAGRLEVTRSGSCATGFRLDGLEADDGTTFGPITAAAGACPEG